MKIIEEVQNWINKKEAERKHLGKIIKIEDQYHIVGMGNSLILSSKHYERFVENILAMEKRISDLTDKLEETKTNLERCTSQAMKLNEILKARENMEKNPKVRYTIQYMVTRFSVRLMKANGVEETIQIMERAEKDLLKFVKHFGENDDDMKSLYEMKDFEPIDEK